jgi:acetyl-CoA carboxylase alpha subunit
LFEFADHFGLPVVTLIDTPGFGCVLHD